MNYENFKIRASASGKIATNPRAKTETLSETTKTYLKEALAEYLFGYKNEHSNKYTERGIASEDLAIDNAIKWLDLPFVLKNEKNFSDDFFTGTPDIIVDGVVYDIKCSWSCFTFPFFETELPNKDYLYQMQVYMHLTNCKKAKVVYCLLDNEEINHFYKVEDNKRYKVFEIDYDEKIIEKLIERVKESREYLKLINK